MFAVVRTGGKQYRVAAGDKIVVDKMVGEAGARVALGDVLFAGNGQAGVQVAAEIVAQAKADKVIVFKKKRRHNYRRKAGHRQQHTILKILSVGDDDGSSRGTVQATPVAAEAVTDSGPATDAPATETTVSPEAATIANVSEDAVQAEPVKDHAPRPAPTATQE